MTDDRETEIATSWERNAGHWSRAIAENRIASRRAGTDRAMVETVARLRPRRMLDLGCGEGWLTRALVEAVGCTVVGVDGSGDLVETARRLDAGSAYLHLSYQAIVAEPGRLPGPFDLIACNFALFGKAVSPLLSALTHVLEPGGAIVIQTLHPWRSRPAEGYRDGWRKETFTGLGDEAWDAMPWYFRTLSSWTGELGAAGLALVEIAEPLDADGGEPLSLVMVCKPVAG
ncbi:methyltransferase domain-containing protein [Nitratireductor sp. CAU 1489]|uniref:Methyltransferase domain-containing protein n=1 Tax=Nitratireductor arenosus TaxID=2682096 RepID=A0A844QE88_9HYPH|nr:class I SAM-dependent methyltransferase [Nitratireductor arenosus]MVA96944.1 methyltransferase domain-containing protein [Nitratireductor arenosus]